MNRSTLFVFAALIGSTAHVQAQGLLQSIVTPEKAVGVAQPDSGRHMVVGRAACRDAGRRTAAS